jgi:cytidine deaminase
VGKKLKILREPEKMDEELVRKARKAREQAYAPYSKFKVGAAVRTSDGQIFTGFNIENSSYSATICAERVALIRALIEGKRNISRIAVIADTEKPCPPCGVCRQFIAEFASDIEVIMANLKGDTEIMNLGTLLPLQFTAKDLENKT